ncbi:MAG: hypothetical protein WD847_11585 [Pirellulales bacterium]
MTQGFWEGWSRHLFKWYGFLFTFVGTIVALVAAKEHWWICMLLVLGAYAAAGSFAYVQHKALKSFEAHQKERIAAGDAAYLQMMQRAEEAERSLAGVSYDVLARLDDFCTQHAYLTLGESFAQHADCLGRMQAFLTELQRPMDLRVFSHYSGELYALAKIVPAATRHVRIGDPFVLCRLTKGGLEVPAAKLIVHQAPNEATGVVSFRIYSYLADEMGHIEGLARTGDVKGIKGYGIKVAYDLTRYGSTDFDGLAKGIRQIVSELFRFSEV